MEEARFAHGRGLFEANLITQAQGFSNLKELLQCGLIYISAPPVQVLKTLNIIISGTTEVRKSGLGPDLDESATNNITLFPMGTLSLVLKGSSSRGLYNKRKRWKAL